jgi:adenylyltransferase/sulfurtransferase
MEAMPKLPPLVEPSKHLVDAETRRYSRHLIILELGVAGQRRIKMREVLCVGAGGLGSPVLTYLAAAGVGTLGIVEFDTVDESNLQRQVIHGQSDLGRPKAISARESIREINPFVAVVLHQEALTSQNAMEICAGYDLIVDCSDNFATRYLVNDVAVLLHKPYVWGSIFRLEGQASVFWADHGPCYRCLYPQPPVVDSTPGGVVGAVCATIGSFQVAEVIKLVTGIGESLLGWLVIYDAATMTVRKIKIRKDAGCAVCGDA